MNVALVHISDLHICEGETLSNEQALRLADAVHGSAPTDCAALFIVVSGDVAYSGGTEQYVQAEACLSVIQNRLADHFTGIPSYWVMVPGNHDADFATQDAVRDHLIQSLSGKTIVDAALIEACTKPFDAFLKLQHRMEGTQSVNAGVQRLCWTRSFQVADRTVVFSCVNSAWVSRRNEVQGSLYLPPQTLRDCLRPAEGSDLSVCVVHHPLNWFESSNSRQIRAALDATCDLVVTGHEHDSASSRRIAANGAHNDYLEGDILVSKNRSGFQPPARGP